MLTVAAVVAECIALFAVYLIARRAVRADAAAAGAARKHITIASLWICNWFLMTMFVLDTRLPALRTPQFIAVPYILLLVSVAIALLGVYYIAHGPFNRYAETLVYAVLFSFGMSIGGINNSPTAPEPLTTIVMGLQACAMVGFAAGIFIMLRRSRVREPQTR